MIPAARAPPAESDIEYSPVISPVRCAKSRLIRAGSSTLPVAIAAPASTVPTNRAGTASRVRTAIPAHSTTSAMSRARSMPTRRASRGAMGASRPKHSTGSAVSTPAVVAESPTLARISASSGDTATTAGRRFAAISTTPTPTQPMRAAAGAAVVVTCPTSHGAVIAALFRPPRGGRTSGRHGRPSGHRAATVGFVTDSDQSTPDSADRLMMLSTIRIGSTAVVTVTGELDLQTARELMTSVDDTLAEPDLGGVVIDLSGVSFLGSSGLGTLAELATRAPASRRPDESPVPVRLVSPAGNSAVIRPWETMHLEQILPLFPDVDAAVADLAG